jgi:arylsulfatase
MSSLHRSQAAALVAGPLLSLLLGGCGASGAGGGDRPLNVVVVMADTLRADHVGAYGHPRGTTPRLDELARQGVLFESTRAQASCTYPSVNSLLTGREPARFLGQPQGHLGIPDGTPSLATLLDERGYSTIAVSASPIVRATPSNHNPTGGFGAGFDRFDEACEWLEGGCVTETALRLLDESRDADREAPFLLYLHYMDPHDPYRPPTAERRRFAGDYAGDKPWVIDGDPNPIAEMLYQDGPDVGVTGADLAFLRGLYDAEIAHFDAQLALLLRGLERRGLLRSTLVVVTSDHGESFLEAGDVKHCRSLFDREIHVPLVLWLPDLEQPRRVAAPVANLDVLPTVLELVDERLLAGPAPAPPMDGRSLVAFIEGGDAAAEPAVVFSSISVLRAATDGRYKLVHHLGHGTWKLYDLAADPEETTDVLAANRRAYHRLRAAMTAWLAEMEGGGDAEATTEAQRRLRALGYLQ